jgi:hypothetical protein
VPWCDPCDRFYNPNTLAEDGNCPEGHTVLADTLEATDTESDSADPKVPWHFWVLVIALVGYLGWRLWDAVAWIFENI